MSRAFTKELDGWNFCRSRQRECLNATFNGRCELDACKYGEKRPNTEAEKKTENENLESQGDDK